MYIGPGPGCLNISIFMFQSIMEIHKTATQHEDAQLTDFLEGEFLKEQVQRPKSTDSR